MRLARLRRLRPDALTLDRVLAVLLTVASQLEIWLGSGTAHHRVATALTAGVVTASVAVRRRYPTSVGTAVPVFAALNFALWVGPQVIEYPIANFCALYALAVWTPPRRFAFGTAVVVAGFLATIAGPESSLRGVVGFTVVVLVVMVLVRRVVGMLRSDAADPLAPQPGLGDLPTLITQVREAGLPVELRVDGVRRDLPVGIELSAYRIVQEALTNALKHAGQAQASVHVRYGPDSLELEIIDDGGGSPAPVSSGGHGLVGMGERVALYGGQFDAGRVPSGGFAVRVLLPIR